MKKLFTLYLPAGLFVSLCLYFLVNPTLLIIGKSYITDMGPYGELVFVLLLTSATVFAPIIVLPLIPLASTIFGPFVTAVLSVIGWTLGAVIAFLIARTLGRPFLKKILNLKRIDDFVNTFPPHMHFWLILLLRHTIPVDLLSYTLGLVKTVKFSTFFFATVLGVTYFSFAFAYAGNAFFKGNTYIFFQISLISVALFGVGWYLVQRYKK